MKKGFNFLRNNKLILAILLIGVIFRLIISANDNFIFNMDNARDMVEVREMVVLGKIRLIGQTTSIDGVFYGPAWYYILAIPFILSGGDPYASILMEILMWAVGGFFLLYLVKKFYGWLAMGVVSCIWVASNFILLGSQYAYNPNPILFLTPVFIFCLWRYIETQKWFFNTIAWMLGGLFLHFEVTVGLFMPLVIILAIIFSGKFYIFKLKSFYLGPLVFVFTLLPQIIFELRHNFFMTKSLLSYKSTSHAGVDTNLGFRTQDLFKGFYNILIPTFMNFKLFTHTMTALFLLLLSSLFIQKKKIDLLTKIVLLTLFVPIIGLIPLKVGILSWYYNASLVAAIFIVGFVIYSLKQFTLGKVMAIFLSLALFVFTVQNMTDYIKAAQVEETGNSQLRTEIKAIDYTYKEAGGKNFKVYTYMPSVYDWPYQYLYWWHGINKYGYLPSEYAYAPNKPAIVREKERLNTGSNPESSGLIFLIKEPDQIGIRHLWENDFSKMSLMKTENIGPLIIETRLEK